MTRPIDDSTMTPAGHSLHVELEQGVVSAAPYRLVSDAERGLADSIGHQDHGGDGKGNHEGGGTTGGGGGSGGRVAEYHASAHGAVPPADAPVDALLDARSEALNARTR